jgi:hypothetical protein
LFERSPENNSLFFERSPEGGVENLPFLTTRCQAGNEDRKLLDSSLRSSLEE